MKRTTALFFTIPLLALAGCKDPAEDAVSLRFKTAALVDGEFAINKGSGTNVIGVEGIDADGNVVHISDGLEWSTSDDTLVQIHPFGEAALCIGTKDWFDTLIPPPVPDAGMDGGEPLADAEMPDGMVPDEDDGGIADDAGVAPIIPFEPHATVTATRGDLSVSVSVAVVLKVGGKWQVFRDGMVDKPFTELSLKQSGRRLSDSLSGADGVITGNQLAITLDPFVLQGTFLSPTEANGTYTAPGGFQGTWSAIRRPEVTAP
jgi:hypothetical protein